MFGSIEIPFGSVMLFNVVKLKAGVEVDDVELAVGEMCNTVKNNYGDENGGFIAGQVFKYAGFISEEGSVGAPGETEEHIAIVTYWTNFETHEQSHKDEKFKTAFSGLMEYCTDTKELGYKLLWQGER